jgi:hypothetical protein
VRGFTAWIGSGIRTSLGIGQRPEGGWLYHGWLKAGVLSDDLDGRTYPPRVD